MSKVKRPEFIVYNEDGSIKELYCKLCGSAIAGEREMSRGLKHAKDGRQYEQLVMRFARFSNYVEAKMQFEDGSFHVTNGCTNCLTPNMGPDDMKRLHEADIAAMPEGFTVRDMHRTPKRIVKVSTDGKGIE